MTQTLTAVVPAAGVGSRMQADRPKQYLVIAGKTILEHTVDSLLQHPAISRVVIAISDGDPYFNHLSLARRPDVIVVSGGSERADSVFSGLATLADNDWVLVHDAARPCLHQDDLSRLIEQAQQHAFGAILAAPVRDTMKRGNGRQTIAATVDRTDLWHALTPRCFGSDSSEMPWSNRWRKGLCSLTKHRRWNIAAFRRGWCPVGLIT